VALSTPGTRVGRLGLVGLAGLALLAGMWAGLVRIGWPLSPIQSNLMVIHGPLMLAGFLGLVIGLERAVALGRSWAFGAPGLAGLGALSLLAGLPVSVSAVLFIGSSVLLALIFGRIYRLRPEWSTALLMLGALAWTVGNALWVAERPLVAVVPWWAGFLVLTIVGERLELAQVLLPERSRIGLLLAAGLLLAGLVLSAALFSAGIQLAGLGLLGLAGWLLRYDLARRTLSRAGLPRFGAVALLLGYLWLGVAGILWLLGPERTSGGFWYDAMLHSVFLGFAFSMIFGHAPTIVPAVTGFAVPFQRRFYVHVVLLHVSLVLRIVGDLASWPEARRWGGLLNVLAILLFAGATFVAARHGRSALAPESRAVPRTISRSRVR
jgi:hypothetical protein